MKTAALFVAAVMATATAAQSQVAMVTIESKSGSARDMSNHTVAITINTPYTDSSTLSAVSGLYLTGAQGVPVDSIICTPFKNDNGTDPEGDAFSSSDPTTFGSVQLGSIVCITNSLPSLPSGLGGSSSFTTSVASKTRHGQSSSTCTSTITTVEVPNTTPTQASSTSTSTTSAAKASQTVSHNVGNSLLASSEFFAGLALAGLGVAFVV